MRLKLKNRQGNISFAMLLLLVGTLSSVAVFYLSFYDTCLTNIDCDKEQVFFFLRSETERCAKVLDVYDALHEGFYLPEKQTTVQATRKTTTYLMQSRLLPADNANSGVRHDLRVWDIYSLVQTKNSAGSVKSLKIAPLTVKGYCERRIENSAGLLSLLQFTDTSMSTNNTPIFYNGADVFYGPVHSNSDIYISQGGGGSNNGWPIFYGHVTTAQRILSGSGTLPYSDIFKAGYSEHCEPIYLNPQAFEIRAHGTTIGPSVYNPNRIMFVTVNGSVFNSMVGLVYQNDYDTVDVWSYYPPPGGNYLFQNRYARYDTLWSAGPSGICEGHSNLVYGKLWLKGNFKGLQTWCAVDTIYLNDDCKLFNTPLGACPDGTVSGSIVNYTDILGIVSEKSILVQYGYKDPYNSVRDHPNCESDRNGIWIYAVLCALGEGMGNYHQNGVFSFEYQHPHPSVPAWILPSFPSYVWNKIDLHRRKFPQSGNQPWPSNIDYPFYNPLWPEASPFLERGSIHLWGSVIQRGNGYIHRKLSEPDYPNPSGIWNIPLDCCGGPAGVPYEDPVLGVTFTPVNAAGATGTGVGYKRDYHYDNRLRFFYPPDFPLIHVYGTEEQITRSWYFKTPPRNLTLLEMRP
ncbi:MAG TPA: hypothetical protein PKJ14_05630 [Candidatus Cloacimonadota bacterium]|nr:hypothetical protein [Candidatus Cloacimonadota bacterium]HQL15528.1 hypothetical protein [Candidatus Cloacimonadota bacterium]